MKAKITILLFCALFFTSFSVLAQPNTELDSSSYQVLEDQDTSSLLTSDETTTLDDDTLMDTIVTPKNLTITPHSFDEANWQKIIEGMNYNRAQPKPIEQKQQKQLDLPNFNFSGLAGVLKVLLWMLLIGILVTILVYLLNSNLFGPSNRKLDSGVVIDLDNIEQHLQESDLEKYLRQALAQKEYKQAIRLYYLMLIKELSAKQYIEWAKEKTNRQYLYELSTKPTLQAPFRESTRIFERVWYGESTFEESDFEQVAPVFQGFLSKIL